MGDELFACHERPAWTLKALPLLAVEAASRSCHTEHQSPGAAGKGTCHLDKIYSQGAHQQGRRCRAARPRHGSASISPAAILQPCACALHNLTSCRYEHHQ